MNFWRWTGNICGRSVLCRCVRAYWWTDACTSIPQECNRKIVDTNVTDSHQIYRFFSSISMYWTNGTDNSHRQFEFNCFVVDVGVRKFCTRYSYEPFEIISPVEWYRSHTVPRAIQSECQTISSRAVINSILPFAALKRCQAFRTNAHVRAVSRRFLYYILVVKEFAVEENDTKE